jgi:hypothetical protein
VPVLLVSASCLDDDPTPRPVPTFTRIVLTLAPTGGGVPQTVEITRATSSASGGFTVPSAGGVITARYLNFDGSEDAVLQQYSPEYETRIFMATGSNVTFARAGKHSFSANRTGTGGIVGTARVQLYDLGKRVEFLGADVAVNTPP